MLLKRDRTAAIVLIILLVLKPGHTTAVPSTTPSPLMSALTADGVDGETIMQMPARFPGPRNTRRPLDSGPLGAQLSNRTFSIGPWKLELERADYPGPESLAAQARPIVRNGPPRKFRPTAPGSWRERRGLTGPKQRWSSSGGRSPRPAVPKAATWPGPGH